MSNLAKHIELVSPDSLKPYEKNARVHSAEQIEKLKASIKEFGFNNPILVDTTKGVIAGHGRLEAAKRLGLAQVPIVILDHLSEKQKQAFILADNRIAEDARWDYDLLKDALEDLDDSDFDLEAIGFTEAELDSMLAFDDPNPPAPPPARIPAAPRSEPLSEAPSEEPRDVPSAWSGMPEFKQEDKTAYRTIHVHFDSEEHVQDFEALVKQKITEKTKYLWYPNIVIETMVDKLYVGKE